jgi:hypothetical protein
MMAIAKPVEKAASQAMQLRSSVDRFLSNVAA